MKQFLWQPIMLLSIVLIISYSCSSGLKREKDDATKVDSTLIEPVSINNLFLDSLSVADFLQSHPEFKAQDEQLWKFYRMRDYQFAWFNNDGMVEQAAHLMNRLSHLREEGISDTFDVNSRLRHLYDSIASGTYQVAGVDPVVSETELLLSATFFRYAEKIWGGIGEKDVEEVEWFIRKKRLPYVAILDSLLSNPTYFAQQQPVYRQYALLKAQLKKYYELEKAGTWPTIEADKKSYKPGDSSLVLPAIRKRLYLLGDLSSSDTSGTWYDSTLVAAVKNFQERHGLAIDGAIGPSMLEALNISVSSRIQQIMINMERCRWVPVELEGDYLAVNIPAYKLFVYEDDSLVWDCNVVVGSINNQTVVFNGNMKYIVFSPYWNIPASIVAKETLPAVKRNQGYLASHNMEVVSGSGVVNAASVDWNKYSGYNFPYTIRQKPGPNNSLGRVKFLFPNNYSIYLHDTPAKSLFNEPARAFSHGCIRVSEPARLAAHLLRKDSAWTADKIETAMSRNKETSVTLETPVPVFIAYFTAWVDRSGRMNFRKDIYGHDGRLAKKMFTVPSL